MEVLLGMAVGIGIRSFQHRTLPDSAAPPSFGHCHLVVSNDRAQSILEGAIKGNDGTRPSWCTLRPMRTMNPQRSCRIGTWHKYLESMSRHPHSIEIDSEIYNGFGFRYLLSMTRSRFANLILAGPTHRL